MLYFNFRATKVNKFSIAPANHKAPKIQRLDKSYVWRQFAVKNRRKRVRYTGIEIYKCSMWNLILLYNF